MLVFSHERNSVGFFPPIEQRFRIIISISRYLFVIDFLYFLVVCRNRNRRNQPAFVAVGFIDDYEFSSRAFDMEAKPVTFEINGS